MHSLREPDLIWPLLPFVVFTEHFYSFLLWHIWVTLKDKSLDQEQISPRALRGSKSMSKTCLVLFISGCWSLLCCPSVVNSKTCSQIHLYGQTGGVNPGLVLLADKTSLICELCTQWGSQKRGAVAKLLCSICLASAVYGGCLHGRGCGAVMRQLAQYD